MKDKAGLGLGPVLELKDDLQDANQGPAVVFSESPSEQGSGPILKSVPNEPPLEPLPESEPVQAVKLKQELPTEAAPAPELEQPQMESVEALEVVASTPESAPEAEMKIEREEDGSTVGLQDEILKLASYADLFDRMLEYAFIMDAESMNLLASNPAAERELGMTPEVFKGKGLSEFVIDDHKEDFIKKLRKARRSYYLFEFDANWKTSDGVTKILNFAACKLKLKNEQEVLQIIARDVTELREAQAKLKNMAVTDEMTKMANFRRFKEKLAEEHERCARYKKEYAIVFCDVDNFKHYNDRNGHPAGDEILKEVAKVMQKCARNTDLPARYGGEEFVVLCPEVDWNNALILAERIRSMLSSLDLPHSKDQPLGCVSVSIGVASFPHDGTTFAEVLHAADQALYVSKKTGRNRVTPHQKVVSGEIKAPELNEKEKAKAEAKLAAVAAPAAEPVAAEAPALEVAAPEVVPEAVPEASPVATEIPAQAEVPLEASAEPEPLPELEATPPPQAPPPKARPGLPPRKSAPPPPPKLPPPFRPKAG